MSTCPGPSCDRPAPRDGTICHACTSDLARNLGDVPAYVHELTITLTRQDRIGERTGARSTETPLAFNAGASEALAVLRSTLVGWCATLNSTVRPGANLDVFSRYLLLHLDDLRQHEAADEACDEIEAALRLARRVIDRPPDRWYAGPCDHLGLVCDGELYAWAGAIDVTCTVCGTVYDLAERRQWLLDTAEDRLELIHDIARALPVLMGRPLNLSTLRSWRFRNQLVPRSLDTEGRELFRIGDVIDLATRIPATAHGA